MTHPDDLKRQVALEIDRRGEELVRGGPRPSWRTRSPASGRLERRRWCTRSCRSLGSSTGRG